MERAAYIFRLNSMGRERDSSGNATNRMADDVLSEMSEMSEINGVRVQSTINGMKSEAKQVTFNQVDTVAAEMHARYKIVQKHYIHNHNQVFHH